MTESAIDGRHRRARFGVESLVVRVADGDFPTVVNSGYTVKITHGAPTGCRRRPTGRSLSCTASDRARPEPCTSTASTPSAGSPPSHPPPLSACSEAGLAVRPPTGPAASTRAPSCPGLCLLLGRPAHLRPPHPGRRHRPRNPPRAGRALLLVFNGIGRRNPNTAIAQLADLTERHWKGTAYDGGFHMDDGKLPVVTGDSPTPCQAHAGGHRQAPAGLGRMGHGPGRV